MRQQHSRTQKERSQETRQRLLEAAREIFARTGFEAARIDDIARRAGYTRGAFYFNFKSKDELFIAVLQDEIRRAHQAIREVGQRYSAPRERLAALKQLYTQLGSDVPFVILVVEFKLYAIRHPRSHAKMAEAFARLRASREDLLGETSKALKLRLPLRIELLELGFWSLCSGLALEHLFSSALSTKDVRSVLTAFFERVLGIEGHTTSDGSSRRRQRRRPAAASTNRLSGAR